LRRHPGRRAGTHLRSLLPGERYRCGRYRPRAVDCQGCRGSKRRPAHARGADRSRREHVPHHAARRAAGTPARRITLPPSRRVQPRQRTNRSPASGHAHSKPADLRVALAMSECLARSDVFGVSCRGRAGGARNPIAEFHVVRHGSPGSAPRRSRDRSRPSRGRCRSPPSPTASSSISPASATMPRCRRGPCANSSPCSKTRSSQTKITSARSGRSGGSTAACA
jgi:hypothetical protein